MYLRADYKDAMRGSDFRYYLTLKGSDEIIGTVCIGQVMFGSVKSCVLSYKIDKDYRGKGYATSCLNYARELAQKENCYKIMLLTGSKEESTLNFYRRAGYNSNDKTAFIQWL